MVFRCCALASISCRRGCQVGCDFCALKGQLSAALCTHIAEHPMFHPAGSLCLPACACRAVCPLPHMGVVRGPCLHACLMQIPASLLALELPFGLVASLNPCKNGCAQTRRGYCISQQSPTALPHTALPHSPAPQRTPTAEPLPHQPPSPFGRRESGYAPHPCE